MRSCRSIAALAIVVWSSAGCERDNMWTQARAPRMGEAAFFADGRAAREPVAGTVSHGSYNGDAHLSHGMEGGKPSERFPILVDAKLMDRGADRYRIFCAPCHGEVGDGRAIVIQRGYRPPKPFAKATLIRKPVGELYRICEFGVPRDKSRQPDILSETGYDLEDVVHPVLWRKLEVKDRWAVLAWLRVLQASQHFPASELSSEELLRMNGPSSGPRSQDGRP